MNYTWLIFQATRERKGEKNPPELQQSFVILILPNWLTRGHDLARNVLVSRARGGGMEEYKKLF